MHWILQENLFRENEWETLINTLERFQIPYSVHKVIPFIGELVPTPVVVDRMAVCFGSYSMRHAAKEFGWTPGVFDLIDENFLVQQLHWGNLMLNNDAEVVAFKDALLHEPAFVRPIDDSKYFAGAVFEPDDFNQWVKNVTVLGHDYGNSLSGDSLIQICKPKQIYSEYRFWVVDSEIVTSSLYKRGDKVMYSSDVDDVYYEFVQEAIKIWQPHRAFVIDVCDTVDGLKIVEINTINSAGFYAGDMQKIVAAINSMQFFMHF